MVVKLLILVAVVAFGFLVKKVADDLSDPGGDGGAGF